MWVPLSTEAAAEIVLDSDATCIYDRREIRLFERTAGVEQTLYSIIRLNDSGYSIWETDFFDMNEAFKVVQSL